MNTSGNRLPHPYSGTKPSTVHQQPGRASAVPDGGQVNDHGDVVASVPGMAPTMFVDPDHLNAVEAGGVVDQQLLAGV